MDDIQPVTSTAPAWLPDPTIAPYDDGLHGVDQTTNLVLSYILWGSFGFVLVVILLVRSAEIIWNKRRQSSTLNASREVEERWKHSRRSLIPILKKQLLYAPLFTKRHSRKFAPFSGGSSWAAGLSFGTLPTRLHAFIILLYLVCNISYTLVLDWWQENRYALYAELRGRSGTLATVNAIPLVILAARNNPLLPLLNLSYDTCILVHRWVGRVVAIEAIIHASAWAVVQVAAEGWRGVGHKILHDQFIASGFAGWLALVVILVTSISPVRSLFYETFLNIHILMAFTIFLCALIHCASSIEQLPQLQWVIAAVTLWFADRLARMARILYCNWSRTGFTTAKIEPMSGSEACRVTMYLPRYLAIRPGSHAYVRFSRVRPWESHPFSIAWSEISGQETGPITEKASPQEGAAECPKPLTAVSFIISAQSGFTQELYRKSSLHAGGPLQMLAAFEGPYAGRHNLDNYGQLVLFAGATGITHQLCFLGHLVRAHNNGTAATRRILLVWIIRQRHALEWIRPYIEEILSAPKAEVVTRLEIYVTRAKDADDLANVWDEEWAEGKRRLSFSGISDNVVTMKAGRPDFPAVLHQETLNQIGAMCVSVCGPGALADDVRAAVRDVQDTRQVVDFVEESFSW